MPVTNPTCSRGRTRCEGVVWLILDEMAHFSCKHRATRSYCAVWKFVGSLCCRRPCSVLCKQDSFLLSPFLNIFPTKLGKIVAEALSTTPLYLSGFKWFCAAYALYLYIRDTMNFVGLEKILSK
ncbi:hypothetical protein IscW_ISCW006390 [Ixodes scapularis]|uniref:Uncharacterized protein n=1 Tax=Ixodes scapularis TaxID=6945 RepID=B7PL86_IXOSC|nr:hypothetical protein IscW_ISCW006390 [Ixodes scapularis]|eukprot:XP_002434534.1 hypothetical protein IscW_ISCW006390 [Ixodes scapularis]